MRFSLRWLVLALPLLSPGAFASDTSATEAVLRDPARHRDIPVEIRLPVNCERDCPVAFLSPGYGLPHTAYRFVTDTLQARGYLVVAIQSVLPGDPPPPDTGNLIADRSPMWRIGADNLRYVKSVLAERYPAYDWTHLLLVGHSNGGDLSALAIAQTSSLASTLVTLDNRRYPLPRSDGIRVLSVRGSDFEADPGVLPPPTRADPRASCIVEIPHSRHDDMHDGGPRWLQQRIVVLMLGFLEQERCGT